MDFTFKWALIIRHSKGNKSIDSKKKQTKILGEEIVTNHNKVVYMHICAYVRLSVRVYIFKLAHTYIHGYIHVVYQYLHFQ